MERTSQMNAPYLEDIRPTFVVHGISPLQSKVSGDKMSEIITGHIKSMKIFNVLMVSSLLLIARSWNYFHLSFGSRSSFKCQSLLSESSFSAYNSSSGYLSAPLGAHPQLWKDFSRCFTCNHREPLTSQLRTSTSARGSALVLSNPIVPPAPRVNAYCIWSVLLVNVWQQWNKVP